MKRCPRCNSKQVKVIDNEMGFIKCQKCGFSELDEYGLVSEAERNTQREKANFNPYKTGGTRRGKK